MTDFPDNPVVGELFNHPNGRVYEFDGTVWSIVRASGSTLQALVNRITALEAELSKTFLVID